MSVAGATDRLEQGSGSAPERNVPPIEDVDAKAMLRQMLLVRGFEERAGKLFQDGQIKGTAHSYIGEEAIATGACWDLAEKDFIVSYHRGHGHCIAKGARLDKMAAELMGRVDGYCRGLGGSMHIADLELNILGANGIVGAGIGLGIGAALAAKQRGDGTAGIAFFGDGASNEGIFHEALNLASIWSLPIVFLCENNQYGLSGRMTDMVGGGSIASRAGGYGIPGERIDGNDVHTVYAAVQRALSAARAGEGPSLIEALTYRWGEHSMRANLPSYRTDEEVESWKAKDPIERLTAGLREKGALADDEHQSMLSETGAEIDKAFEFAFASGEPELDILDAATLAPIAAPAAPPPEPGERKLTFAEAINEALTHEMTRDERVFVVGEDIGKIGGLFKVTKDLLDRFGPLRVLDTPISENGFAAAAVGAAIAGQRPVMELQFFDFVTHTMDQIVNQAAKFRYMLGGAPTVPLVIRGPQGSGVRLAAQHSQSLEAWFAHVPGLIVIAPSTPYDAKGLMTAAIRNDNPVIFLEHKLLYLGQDAAVPEESYEIEIGKADVKREGSDVTVVATSVMVERALSAAEKLGPDGISVEVVDPRTLRPLDVPTIVESVKKTNRCVVVHEAWKTGGIGGEIAARIMEEAFDWLDAPVARVCGRDVPMPYNDKLERAVVPTQDDIITAVREILYRPLPA
ncbi:MAG: alpha-ketoacid dehydrogenase subunit alpha/beta [Methyloligellaceae bacterium]